MPKKRMLKIIQELRNSVSQCALPDMTFAPIPAKYKDTMKEYMANRYRIWSQSWIIPQLAELENMTQN